MRLNLPVLIDSLLGYQILFEILGLPCDTRHVSSFQVPIQSLCNAQGCGYDIAYLSSVEIEAPSFCLDPVFKISEIFHKLFAVKLFEELIEDGYLLLG